MISLGSKIKYLRGGLTQEELAATLKVDRSTLASWEINRREPDIATLCRLASFFKVSIDWLVGYVPEALDGIPPDKLLETPVTYHTEEDAEWRTVIDMSKAYGLTAEDVRQLIEVTAKITRGKASTEKEPS